MKAQYGLLFFLALRAHAPRERGLKAEDAFYARFSENPLRRLIRLLPSRRPAIKPAGANDEKDAGASCKAVPSPVLGRPAQARTAPSGRTACKVT